MNQELVFTSARRGLGPGKSGFCTVASTAGMATPVIRLLENLSGYRHLYAPTSDQANLNPIIFSHLATKVGGKPSHVISRVANAGLDYSNRSNKIAHHIVLSHAQSVAGGPLALLGNESLFETEWTGDPRIIPDREFPGQPISSAPCVTWGQLAGHAGWAGELIDAFRKKQTAYLIVRPDTPALQLISEALALLPLAERWDVSFSTFFTKLPPGIDCQWCCIMEGTPEVAVARRNSRNRIIDLANCSGVPDNPYVQNAVDGTTVQAISRGRPAPKLQLGSTGKESPAQQPPRWLKRPAPQPGAPASVENGENAGLDLVMAPPPIPSAGHPGENPALLSQPVRRRRSTTGLAAKFGCLAVAALLLIVGVGGVVGLAVFGPQLFETVAENDGGSDGQGEDGQGEDGQGEDGQGEDGQGTDDKGTDGKGQGGKGEDGKGQDGKGQDGKGTDGKDTDDKDTDGKGTDDKGTDDKGTDDKGTDDKDTDDKDTDGKRDDGEGTGGKGDDGKGPMEEPTAEEVKERQSIEAKKKTTIKREVDSFWGLGEMKEKDRLTVATIKGPAKVQSVKLVGDKGAGEPGKKDEVEGPKQTKWIFQKNKFDVFIFDSGEITIEKTDIKTIKDEKLELLITFEEGGPDPQPIRLTPLVAMPAVATAGKALFNAKKVTLPGKLGKLGRFHPDSAAFLQSQFAQINPPNQKQGAQLSLSQAKSEEKRLTFRIKGQQQTYHISGTFTIAIQENNKVEMSYKPDIKKWIRHIGLPFDPKAKAFDGYAKEFKVIEEGNLQQKLKTKLSTLQTNARVASENKGRVNSRSPNYKDLEDKHTTAVRNLDNFKKNTPPPESVPKELFHNDFLNKTVAKLCFLIETDKGDSVLIGLGEEGRKLATERYKTFSK